MASEHNITHRQAIAYWFQVNLFIRRGLHCCNKVGACGSRCFIRYCGILLRWKGGSLQRLYEDIFDILECASFHPLDTSVALQDIANRAYTTVDWDASTPIQVAQAGGLRIVKLSACPTQLGAVQPLEYAVCHGSRSD